MQLSENACKWLANGERGLSSNTMFEAITGIIATKNGWRSHPYDPADLGRCRKLLEECPEFKDKLHLVAKLSSEWHGLIEQWDALCQEMDKEAPKWREGIGNAPKTWKIMQEILNRTNK